MTKKREHPIELARRELRELTAVMLRESRERRREPWWPAHLPPPELGSWPTLQLARLLNLAAKEKKLYVYTLILQLWLLKQGINVPERIFSHKITGPGTGKRPSREKREFGERAWRRQVELIIGDDKENISKRERVLRAQRVWDAAPSYKAAQITKELLLLRYCQGGRTRAAAIKYVTEAIAAVKLDA